MLLAQVSTHITAVVDRHLGTDWADNPEILALLSLRLHPAPTTRHLRDRSGLDRRAVNRLVHRLEDEALVVTARSPVDGRAVTVTLTGHGRSRLDHLARDLDSYFDTAVPTAGEILTWLGCGQTPGTAPPADSLTVLEQLATAGTHLAADLNALEGLPELSGRQRVALVQIATGDSIRPGDLAGSLGANPPTVTYVINQLAAKGLITRSHGTSHDGRAVVLAATDAGRHGVDGVYRAIRSNTPELCSAFAAITRRPHPSGARHRTRPSDLPSTVPRLPRQPRRPVYADPAACPRVVSTGNSTASPGLEKS